MAAAFASGAGNASSVHWAGARARAILEASREEVAAAIGAHPTEIVFTSGATEANNIAIAGVAASLPGPLTVAVPTSEHSSVLGPARALAARGHTVVLLPVSGAGLTESAAVTRVDADLLSVALVNAETGVIQDCAALSVAARRRKTLVHVDAAQAVAVLAIDVDALGADLLTLSGHKLGGPPGTGALYVRRGTHLEPLEHGGPQEHGLRPGSENVPALAGFAAALGAAVCARAREAERLAELTDRLRDGIRTAWPAARFAGEHRSAGERSQLQHAPHILNVAFPGVEGESLVAALDLEGIAVSAGSACAAGAAKPSHVLLAMGWSPQEAKSALRISLGWASTTADVDEILTVLPRVLERARRRNEETAWPAHAS